MVLKYIILKKENTPLIFPRKPFSHYEIAQNKGEVLSAGFCIFSIKENEITVTCFGSSSTLDIDSNPSEDKIIIEAFIKY